MSDPDDEHFPWHYTEFGVICACGEAMRNEICTAAPVAEQQDEGLT